MKIVACSFFGHRKIEITEELKQNVKEIIEDLIVNHKVSVFLFGSRSDFDNLCHSVVSKLKDDYPKIKRISYTCASESCMLENERLKWEEIYSRLHKKQIHLLGFEKEVEHKTKYTAGRASYIERNRAMINDSDYCVFYYDENYKPPPRKRSRKDIGYYQPKSGTKLAYEYARQKKKFIINVLAKQKNVIQF